MIEIVFKGMRVKGITRDILNIEIFVSYYPLVVEKFLFVTI